MPFIHSETEKHFLVYLLTFNVTENKEAIGLFCLEW